MEVEKKKPKKEEVDRRITSTLNKLKSRIILESGRNSKKLASVDRILTRNTINRQNKG